MLIHTIGREQKKVALSYVDRTVVDLDLRIDAQSAPKIALLRRNGDPVVLGQLFKRVPGDAVNSGVANVKNVCGRRLDDHGAERAHIDRKSTSLNSSNLV